MRGTQNGRSKVFDLGLHRPTKYNSLRFVSVSADELFPLAERWQNSNSLPQPAKGILPFMQRSQGFLVHFAPCSRAVEEVLVKNMGENMVNFGMVPKIFVRCNLCPHKFPPALHLGGNTPQKKTRQSMQKISIHYLHFSRDNVISDASACFPTPAYCPKTPTFPIPKLSARVST